jgi:DNA-binding MarR family transcriptional regulator
MTQILKKMTVKDLLILVKDEQDKCKRKRLLQLTQQGQNLKANTLYIPNEISCKSNSIDSAQVNQLVFLLYLVLNDLAE